MGVSIACGVSASADAAGWLVALGDMPLVPTSQHRVVADALRAGADIAAPVCQGRRGHPVGFAARFGDELRALDGDEGARAVLARHREALLELVVDDDAGWQDIDTPSDLAAVNRKLLLDAGVREDRLSTAGLCTRCRPDLFYSHRRDGALRGSMAAFLQD